MAPCLCCADLSLMHWGCHGTMSWRGLRRWPTRIRKTIKFGTIGKQEPAVSYDPWGLWSNSTRPLLCLLLTRTSRAHLNSVPSLDLLSCRAFLSASTASFEPPPPQEVHAGEGRRSVRGGSLPDLVPHRRGVRIHLIPRSAPLAPRQVRPLRLASRVVYPPPPSSCVSLTLYTHS